MGFLTDEEGKTGDISELSFRKRPKKDMYSVSAPATLLNKRKRWRMAQDNQPFGSLEEVKAEHDDELSSPPQLQKHGKSRVRFKVMFMEIIVFEKYCKVFIYNNMFMVLNV